MKGIKRNTPKSVMDEVVKLKPGDKLTTVGRKSKEHTPTKAEKTKVRTVNTTRKLGKGLSALAVLDVADTFFEGLEQGLDYWDAVKAVPEVYVDGLVKLGQDIYDSVKDQDYVRLGSVLGDAADISTPITRAVDLIGRHVGAGNIASQAVDDLRNVIGVEGYSTSDSSDDFLGKVVSNWQKIGTPTDLVSTVVGSTVNKLAEVFANGSKERKENVSPRYRHETERKTPSKGSKGTGKR